MRILLILMSLLSSPALSQIPDSGDFRYILYDNDDQQVGTYSFTIQKSGDLWIIASKMDIDTSIFMLRVQLNDHNSFTHDGRNFLSFQVSYFKDVPLQSIVRQQVIGERQGDHWDIQMTRNGQRNDKSIPSQSFAEIRNLISRLIRPEAILRPGQSKKALSLDPLTLEISSVESLGVREETVEFQGRQRKLSVMQQKADDGDVQVKKFDNGLIYRSQTANGYALLKSALSPTF